jgi:imidazole glycerol-phosphate synthase subunit HisF
LQHDLDVGLLVLSSKSDTVPVLRNASGGVGNLDHTAVGIQTGGANAVLAASIFHYGEYTVK